MKKQFVTYEIAIKLEELGFNEKCLGSYCVTPKFDAGDFELGVSYSLKAPLWQQAIDWLREEHKLHVSVLPFRNVEVGDEIVLCFYYTLTNLDGNLSIFLNTDTLCASIENFDTPEIAREKGISEAIEIVKKRQEEGNHVN